MRRIDPKSNRPARNSRLVNLSKKPSTLAEQNSSESSAPNHSPTASGDLTPACAPVPAETADLPHVTESIKKSKFLSLLFNTQYL